MLKVEKVKRVVGALTIMILLSSALTINVNAQELKDDETIELPIPGPTEGDQCCPIDEGFRTIGLPPIPGPTDEDNCFPYTMIQTDMISGYSEITLVDYEGYSLVEGLKMFGYDSSFAYRSELACALGISNYVGSYEQNAYLLTVLKDSIILPKEGLSESVSRTR